MSAPTGNAARPPVTCLILAYNEAARIRTALTHALQWADEVVVLDKGSTDGTAAIALELGARVQPIPFSPQGHECYEDLVASATHDWVWGFTPGEVPTRACIEAGLGMVGDHVDLVMVPMHYYSFGVHHPASPWAGGWQPRLYHRRRVTFTGITHDPIRASRPASIIPRGPECYVLHPTHASAESFIRSHADYASREGAHETPAVMLPRAFTNMSAFDSVFSGDSSLLGQQLGWKLYWLMVALHAWQRTQDDITDRYSALAGDHLARHWTGPIALTPPPKS
jgi:hypothetical protein